MAQESREPTENSRGLRRAARYGAIVVAVLAVQAVMTWLFVEFGLRDRTTEDSDELIPDTVLHERPRVREGPVYQYRSEYLQRILCNPAGTNAQRYVVADVELGLRLYDLSLQRGSVDVTPKLGRDVKLLALAEQQAPRMRSIISAVLRAKTIDQFEGDALAAVAEEVKKRLNSEVFASLLDAQKTPDREIRVAEVLFTGLVIQ